MTVFSVTRLKTYRQWFLNYPLSAPLFPGGFFLFENAAAYLQHLQAALALRMARMRFISL